MPGSLYGLNYIIGLGDDQINSQFLFEFTSVPDIVKGFAGVTDEDLLNFAARMQGSFAPPARSAATYEVYYQGIKLLLKMKQEKNLK